MLESIYSDGMPIAEGWIADVDGIEGERDYKKLR